MEFRCLGRSSVSSGVILRNVAGVVLMSLSSLEQSNILGFLGEVNLSSVGGCVICGFFSVVLGGFDVVARCSVG